MSTKIRGVYICPAKKNKNHPDINSTQGYCLGREVKNCIKVEYFIFVHNLYPSHERDANNVNESTFHLH